MQSIDELLGSNGPFAAKISDFAAREQQQQMALAVAQTLDDFDTLIAEAGTGTGKTFAYLIPALLSGKKIIISTGTKNLQDQIFYRDLPKVLEVLDVPVSTSLLKGRSNYFCHYRFEQKQLEGRLTPQQHHEFHHLKDWLHSTKSGDISELTQVSEHSNIWPYVTSTVENCLGSDCPFISDCFVMQARRKAQESEVVIVNHHLFFADMVLRDEGFGEVLPTADCFIFDEAHQLLDTATRFFGDAISSRQFMELARDSKLEILQQAPDSDRAIILSDAVEQNTKELRLAFGVRERRAPWLDVNANNAVAEALQSLNHTLSEFEQCLKRTAERSAGLEKCWQRSWQLLQKLGAFSSTSNISQHSDDPDDQSQEQQVLWYETHTRGFVLHKTPISVASQFSAYMKNRQCAWVFTSATLSVGGRFDHFSQGLGIGDARACSWDSPFDFKQQALLYAPQDMPDPNSESYVEAVIKVVAAVIEISRGRTFVLVTSYRNLNAVAAYFRKKINFPLLVQGDLPRTELLERFRSLGNAVLIGTSSFWEGVDVKGEALSCVIIDKLPFSAPDDPVLQARIDEMQKCGANAFMSIQLPRAVIALKQGVGRLIRDINDRGVLVICDPRLYTKSYGRVFIRSLPPMETTRDMDQVIQFFNQE
ncbi:ATP-dependent DNA helicase [Kaarinaea lacus]